MDDSYECAIGSFDDEVETLVQYGHDCCARIDDRIHECCERIKDAHNVEVDAYAMALGWKQEQDTLVAYDVLGNERHKVMCELEKLKFRGEGIGYDGGVPPVMNVQDVANLLGAICDLTDDWPSSLAKVRDTLIHLLGGDAKHPSLSDLFGILKEDKDGMDAGRCGETSAVGGVSAAAKRRADCDDNQPSDGVAPITQELRDYLSEVNDNLDEDWLFINVEWSEVNRLFDTIDAVHASLERENEELRQRTMYPAESERINMLEREVKRLTAECKTQRNNFDQATNARKHWENLYEQSLEHVHDLEHEIHDLEHDVEVWRDRAEDMRMERDDALKEHHAWAPESHYMMLPKDSDGVPVHVGDVVEWCDSGDAIDVIGIGANDTLFYVDSDGDGEQAEWTTARNKRVRRADTWESIIKDAISEGMARERCNKECCDHSGALSNADLVARCKAMVGDAE